jgi:hypothetical protein
MSMPCLIKETSGPNPLVKASAGPQSGFAWSNFAAAGRVAVGSGWPSPDCPTLNTETTHNNPAV